MNADERQQLEVALRRHHDAGELARCASEAVRRYGHELFGFLVGLCRDRQRAEDLFADLCERIWRGLPAFRWDSSFRVWAYALARHAFIDTTRAPRVAAVPLSAAPELVQAVRTATASFLATEVKDELARLRASLAPEEQMLLGLRLEGQMGWRDIARVVGGTGDVDRRAAALRKKYERLKERLQQELG